MKKSIFFLLLAGTMLLNSCSNDPVNNNNNNNNNHSGTQTPKGDRYYGGTFNINEVTDFRNLFPHSVTEVVSQRIANQVYEGLVKLNQKDLSVEPSIAEKWDVNDSATVYTFHLRKGVKFHNDPSFEGGQGREVTAHDFKYCFERLCTANEANLGFYTSGLSDKILGAEEYYMATQKGTTPDGGVKGIKVLDDYTLQLELNYPFAGFLNLMATQFTWVYPKEAWEKYGLDMREKCVGTGPFILEDVKPGSAVTLIKNNEYWGKDEFGNQLPYLDAVKISFIKEKKAELLEFRKKNLHMVFELPIEEVDNILGEFEEAKKGGNPPFKLQVEPALNFQYYGFQHKLPPFNNELVRKAFNYAINKKELIKYTLQGHGQEAVWGIVPPSFENYDTKSIKGYSFNPEKARELITQAGFPNGEGFPEVSLNVNDDGGRRNVQIAQVIQKMLEDNLNIKTKLEVLPFAAHLEKIENGNAVFFRAGWTADYPDPGTFLTLLYGGHVPESMDQRSPTNTFRYQSAKFDSLYDLALRELDEKKRMELYRRADQIAIDDAAIMPIFYDEHYRLLQLNVRNFDANAMEYRNMAEVYFQPDV